MAAGGAGSGGNFKEHRGSLEILAASAGVKVGASNAGGARDPFSGKSATAAANAAKGELSANEANVMGNEGGVYTADSKDALAAKLKSEAGRKAAQAGIASGANAGQAVMGVTKALEAFVASLKDMVRDGSTGKAQPKQQGPK
jgi:hypothetical protein